MLGLVDTVEAGARDVSEDNIYNKNIFAVQNL